MKSFRLSILRFLPAAELIVHPEHNRTLQIHDIALLKLGLKSSLVWSLTNFQGKGWTLPAFLLSAFLSMDRILMAVSAMSMVTFTFLDWGCVYISVTLIPNRLGWNKWRVQLCRYVQWYALTALFAASLLAFFAASLKEGWEKKNRCCYPSLVQIFFQRSKELEKQPVFYNALGSLVKTFENMETGHCRRDCRDCGNCRDCEDCGDCRDCRD